MIENKKCRLIDPFTRGGNFPHLGIYVDDYHCSNISLEIISSLQNYQVQEYKNFLELIISANIRDKISRFREIHIQYDSVAKQYIYDSSLYQDYEHIITNMYAECENAFIRDCKNTIISILNRILLYISQGCIRIKIIDTSC